MPMTCGRLRLQPSRSSSSFRSRRRRKNIKYVVDDVEKPTETTKKGEKPAEDRKGEEGKKTAEESSNDQAETKTKASEPKKVEGSRMVKEVARTGETKSIKEATKKVPVGTLYAIPFLQVPVVLLRRRFLRPL